MSEKSQSLLKKLGIFTTLCLLIVAIVMHDHNLAMYAAVVNSVIGLFLK